MIDVCSVIKCLEDIGALTAEDCKKAMPFCLNACTEISHRLRRDDLAEEPAVIMACAGLALYRYSLAMNASGEDFSSLKAGDVTISRSPAAMTENAVRFRDEAMSGAARYLTDVDFVFETVEI